MGSMSPANASISHPDATSPRCDDQTSRSVEASPATSTGSGPRNMDFGIGMRAMLQDPESSSESEDEDAEDVYLKMKQKLLGGKAEEIRKESRSTGGMDGAAIPSEKRAPPVELLDPSGSSPSGRRSMSPATHSSDTDSESEVPVASRKRRRAGPFMEDAGSDKSSASDSEKTIEPEDKAKNRRLQELINLRRQQRLDKEMQEKPRERSPRVDDAGHASASDEKGMLGEEGDEDPIVDREVDDKLTQQARPTRKASKKAIEEMNKETQRMARNMQLTHQAKVKKKFSMADFAARFSAKSKRARPDSAKPPASSSAPVSSDAEKEATVETPPSSPPSEGDAPSLGKSIFDSRQDVSVEQSKPDQDKDLPTVDELLTQCLVKKDKGKGRAEDPPPPPSPKPEKRKVLSPRSYRITPLMHTASKGMDDSSDDDLEIVKDRLSIFNSIQPRTNNASKAEHNLRLLANLNAHEPAPSKKSKSTRPSMTAGQLDLMLRKRAALQTKQERDEKIAALRAKGILVQTQEERERDMMEIEDLLEKARKEADELRKKEKAAAKEEGTGELGLVASDDESGDEEWKEDDEDVPEQNAEDGEGEEEEEDDDEEGDAMELSGSEDEEMDEDEDERGENSGLVDDAADEADDESESDIDHGVDEDEVDKFTQEDADKAPTSATPLATSRRTHRKRFVVEDDEDEEETAIPSSQPPPVPAGSDEPGSINEVAAAFGFGAAPAALLSPSQMFAGTMGASQTQRDSQLYGSQATQEQDSMDLFNQMVPSANSQISPMPYDDESQVIHAGPTQTQGLTSSTQSPELVLGFTPAPLQSPAMSRLSQMSAIPSPSQDIGFGFRDSPLVRAQNFAPQSTIETVMLSIPESPIPQRKGRLQHRKRLADEESVDEELAVHSTQVSVVETPIKTTAFDVMRKAAEKPAQPDFDKKKSDAKKMVDEQAEESEDEYAGLGGASDDGSGDEADEADKQMIDESDVKVDERKLAAFYAEKARLENEAQTSKLYKDLMSGALRRQRGGDAFDLDSDEDEQIAERRRRRQREEARKRRLLLGDEKLGKFDGNEKKEAFLRAIEDREEEDGGGDVDMLDGKDRDAEDEPVPDSQTQEDSQEGLGQTLLQPVSGNAPKRKAETPAFDGPFKKPMLAGRRTANAAFVKPASFAEVKESVSFLVDEPHAQGEKVVQLSDSEGEDEDGGERAGEQEAVPERAPYSARRTPAKPAVVDRLLMRQSSSSVSATEGAGGMAFVSRSSSSVSLFKLPSLLRRATTSSTSTNGGMAPPLLKRDGSSSMSAGGRDEGVRRGGGKKSSINYAAREAERRAVVDKVERRRKADVKRVADLHRMGGSLSGLGMRGGFE